MKNQPKLQRKTIITISGTLSRDGEYEIEDIRHNEYHLRNTKTNKLCKHSISAIENSIEIGIVTVTSEEQRL